MLSDLLCFVFHLHLEITQVDHRDVPKVSFSLSTTPRKEQVSEENAVQQTGTQRLPNWLQSPGYLWPYTIPHTLFRDCPHICKIICSLCVWHSGEGRFASLTIHCLFSGALVLQWYFKTALGFSKYLCIKQ